MYKILVLSILLFILGGCSTAARADKEEVQERSENIDLIIDGLDDLIEESEEIHTGS